MGLTTRLSSEIGMLWTDKKMKQKPVFKVVLYKRYMMAQIAGMFITDLQTIDKNFDWGFDDTMYYFPINIY